MAIASAAWKRTATASSSALSIFGSSRWRTTICWFDTPSRTRRGSEWVLKKSRRASARASTSVTSPSVMMPGASSALTAREIPSGDVWTAAMNSPSRSRPTMPRLLFFLPRERAMRVPCKLGYRSLVLAALARQEELGIQVDQLGPCDERSQPSEREEEAERHLALALRNAAACHHHRADERSGEARDQGRRRERQAEVEAHHAEQLHVAHAHPARGDQRHHEQEREAGGPCDEKLGQLVRPDERRHRHAPHRERREDPVRDDLELD